MPRSKPESSWDAACRHLFRHFHEPGELERNPIYQRFLAVNCARETPRPSAFAALQSAVERAARDYELKALAEGKPEVGRRGREIAIAHILRRHGLERVAAEVHLSRAQFYRERRAVCRFIAGLLGSAPKRELPSLPIDVDEIAIARAQSLVQACELDTAIGLFEKIGHESSSIPRRIEAFCLAAEACVAQVEFERARSRLRDARAIASGEAARLTEEQATVCRLRIAYTSVLLSASESGAQTVSARLAELLADLRSAYRDDAGFLDLQFDALFFACDRSRLYGSFGEGHKYLSAARVAFAAMKDPKLEQRLRLVRLESLLCNDRGTEITFEEAARVQITARDLALKNGLVFGAIDASLNLSSISGFGLGDFERSFAETLPLLTWASQSNNPQVLGFVTLTLVDLFIGSGRFLDAAKLLESTDKTAKFDLDGKSLIHCLAAEAFLGLRQYSQAIAYAEAANRMAASSNNRRFQSAALRTSALANFARGNAQQARDRIGGAIQLADSAQGRTAAAMTYLASSVITGDRTHARIARSLNRNARLR